MIISSSNNIIVKKADKGTTINKTKYVRVRFS